MKLMLLVEERWLSGSRKQSLPMLLIWPQTVLIRTDHLLNRNHSHSILQVSDREVGISAHQALDTAQCNLAK